MFMHLCAIKLAGRKKSIKLDISWYLMWLALSIVDAPRPLT